MLTVLENFALLSALYMFQLAKFQASFTFTKSFCQYKSRNYINFYIANNVIHDNI